LQDTPDSEALQYARYLRRERGRRGIRLVLATSLLAFLAGLGSSSLFWVSEVRVVAPDPGLAQAVARALSVPAQASSLFYPVSRLERQAAALPQVESVTVRREPPHHLVVNVNRRVPVAVLAHPSGLLLVGEDGVITHLLAPTDRAPRLPLFVGVPVASPQPGGRLTPDWTEWVTQAAGAATDAGLAGAFRLDCSQNLDLRLTADGVEGFLGATDNLERKVKLFAALLAELRRQGGDPAYIDVRVMERPVWMPRGGESAPAAKPTSAGGPVARPPVSRAAASDSGSRASSPPSDKPGSSAAAKPKPSAPGRTSTATSGKPASPTRAAVNGAAPGAHAPPAATPRRPRSAGTETGARPRRPPTRTDEDHAH
jgi:cell division septal protein FtsQ